MHELRCRAASRPDVIPEVDVTSPAHRRSRWDRGYRRWTPWVWSGGDHGAMATMSPSPGANDPGIVFGGEDASRPDRSRLVSVVSVAWSVLALLGLCLTTAVILAAVGQAVLAELLG